MLNHYFIQIFIEFMFSLGMFVNALLFIPQIIQLLKLKRCEQLSFLTFFGFNVIQFFGLMHGIIKHDMILIFGFAISLATCGTLTTLILYYRIRYTA